MARDEEELVPPSQSSSVFVNSLGALSYRFALQKWRAPVGSIVEILLPLALILLFGLATMPDAPFQTGFVKAYTYSETQYDACLAGMYGPALQPDFPNLGESAGARLPPELLQGTSAEELFCTGAFPTPTLLREGALSSLAVLLSHASYNGVAWSPLETPLFVVRDAEGEVINNLDHPFAEFLNQAAAGIFGTQPTLVSLDDGTDVAPPTANHYIGFDDSDANSFHLRFHDFGDGATPMTVDVLGPFGSTIVSGFNQIRSDFYVPFYSFSSFPNNLDPFGQSKSPVSSKAVNMLLLSYAKWLENGKTFSFPTEGVLHPKEAWVFLRRAESMNRRVTPDVFDEFKSDRAKIALLADACEVVVDAHNADFTSVKDRILKRALTEHFALFRHPDVGALWSEVIANTDAATACEADPRWIAFEVLIEDAATINELPKASRLQMRPIETLIREARDANGFAKKYAEDLVLTAIMTLWDKTTIAKFEPHLLPYVEPAAYKESAFPNREGYYSLFGEFFSANASADFFFLAGLCVVVDRIARTIMVDKELKIFSFLSVFGATMSQYYAAVYLFFGGFYSLLALFMAAASFYPYQNPDFFVLFLSYWLVILQLMSWTVFVCSFFRQPSLAAYTAIFTVLFGGSLQMFANMLESVVLDIILCLLPQNAILR